MAGLTLEVWHLRSAAALLLAAAVRSFIASESSSILLALLALLLWLLSAHANRQDANEQAEPATVASEVSPSPILTAPAPSAKKDDAAELFKQWTGNVVMADTGVAMPAAQIARAWLQMARSKGHGPIPSKSSFSSLVKNKRRVGSSSDLCGSITEGDESAGSPWDGPSEDAFYVQLERQSTQEDWGFVWQQPALTARRRFFLESVSEDSPAANWNARERELGRSSVEPGSILVEVNGLAGYGVIRHELREAMSLRLTFLRPPEIVPAESKLAGLRLECRVKNSFLEVSPIDAESQDEARHFSDPGPAVQKGFSSSAEGVSAAEPQICGYHTESEAVSDLIGTAALITGLVRSSEFNGKWCRIDAFDPEVRRYIVRVFLEDGQPPVIAKLRLDNLILETAPAVAPTMMPANFQHFAQPAPGPVPTAPAAQAETADVLTWPWWPWMPGMAGAVPSGAEPDAWQAGCGASEAFVEVPTDWAAYPYGPPGLPSTEAAMMQCMPAAPPPQTPLCILPTTSPQFATSDAAAVSNAGSFEMATGGSQVRPVQIHTHQALEQHLIQQQMQTLQPSAAPDVQDAEQPSVSSSMQQDPADPSQQPEAEEPEDIKKKRRRRRRGKRRGKGNKDAQEADDDADDSDIPEELKDDTAGEDRGSIQPAEAPAQTQEHGAGAATPVPVPESSPSEASNEASLRKQQGGLPEDPEWKPRLDGTEVAEVPPWAPPSPLEATADSHRQETAELWGTGPSAALLEVPTTVSSPAKAPTVPSSVDSEAVKAQPRGAAGPLPGWRPSLARKSESLETLESRLAPAQEPARSVRSDIQKLAEFHETSESATWQPSLQRRSPQ